MIVLVIVVLVVIVTVEVVVVVVVVVEEILRTSSIHPEFLGFLWKFFRKSLGRGLLQDHMLVPPPALLCPPPDKVETVYSCAIDVSSKTDERRLTSLRNWYQILDKLNPRLAVRGEWCCDPRLKVGIYEAYLLGGLRLPLNAFSR